MLVWPLSELDCVLVARYHPEGTLLFPLLGGLPVAYWQTTLGLGLLVMAPAVVVTEWCQVHLNWPQQLHGPPLHQYLLLGLVLEGCGISSPQAA